MRDKLQKYLLPNLPYVLIGIIVGRTSVEFSWIPYPPALIGLIGAVLLRFYVYQRTKTARKFRRDAEYGSARFGTAKDIKPFVDPKFQNNVILTGSEFLTMNTRPKNPGNARNLNCCVIGGSGSGKTRFWLAPQLLQAHSSYVCVDPKGLSWYGQIKKLSKKGRQHKRLQGKAGIRGAHTAQVTGTIRDCLCRIKM